MLTVPFWGDCARLLAVGRSAEVSIHHPSVPSCICIKPPQTHVPAKVHTVQYMRVTTLGTRRHTVLLCHALIVPACADSLQPQVLQSRDCKLYLFEPSAVAYLLPRASLPTSVAFGPWMNVACLQAFESHISPCQVLRRGVRYPQSEGTLSGRRLTPMCHPRMLSSHLP